MDIDVERVWNNNITGRGVTVAIVDDGELYGRPLASTIAPFRRISTDFCDIHLPLLRKIQTAFVAYSI